MNINNRPSNAQVFKHYDIAIKLLPKKKLQLLDYGSGWGEFIGNLKNHKWNKYGVEVDLDKLEFSTRKYKDVVFKRLVVGKKTVFPSNFFDYVFMFHVLEHVDSENKAISEIHRILKKDGFFFLASPYNGIFAWADTANLRFRFPRIHKFFAKLILGNREYEQRFTTKRGGELSGDCFESRTWHKHYSETELVNLLKNKFEIQKIYKFSLFYPFLLLIYNFFHYISGKHYSWTTRLVNIDNHIAAGNYSYNFFLIAKKI